MADGSIIIDTRIDTGGVSKGMNAVKAGMARISAQVSKIWHTSRRYKKKMGIVRDMGDLQREIDKSRKLAYNILIKTASKGSQGSPSWQICLAKI